jgi:HAD superfamily hydrolase (TIGR01509 family)
MSDNQTINPSITTVIFDYAGVLTPTQDNFIFAKTNHAKYNMSLMHFFEATYANWSLARNAKITPLEFWKGIAEAVGENDPIVLRDSIIRTFPANNEMIDLIKKLRLNNVNIGMISNQVEDWINKFLVDNDLKHSFDCIHNSYHSNYSKPDPQIFEEFCAKARVSPSSCLFIDDQEKNCLTARKLGMKTIVCKNMKDFQIQFKKIMYE